MRLHNFIRSLKKDAKTLRTAYFACSLAVFAVVFMVAMLEGIVQNFVKPLLPELPVNVLRLEPKTFQLGLLAFGSDSVGSKISHVELESRIQKLSGVKSAHAIIGANFPLRAEGGESFLGRRIYTDVFATGITPSLVEPLSNGVSFAIGPDGVVPVVIAKRLLAMYNSTVAPAMKKPKLSENAVLGFEFDLTLGRSIARDPTFQPEHIRARIVGFSEYANIVGLSVPLSAMESWNQRFTHESGAITSLIVEMQRPDKVSSVLPELKAMGFDLDQGTEALSILLRVVLLAIALFALLVLILSVFAISQSFLAMVSQRRLEFAILRALGARPSFVSRFLWGQALSMGLFAALSGILFAGFLGAILNRVLEIGNISQLDAGSGQLFILSWISIVSGLALGICSACIGAWLPIKQAAAIPPNTVFRMG